MFLNRKENEARTTLLRQVTSASGAGEGIGLKIAFQLASLGAAVYSSYLCQQVRFTDSVKSNNKLPLQPYLRKALLQ